MKFNSINCIDKNYLLHDILYNKFAFRSKLKNIIESKKSATVNPEIDIQPVNAKCFFRMA